MQLPRNNIAARAGRWSARNRKKALVGWIAFVVLAYLAGGSIGTNELTQAESGVGESGAAQRIVADGYPDRVDELVLVQSKSLKTGDPEFKAVVQGLTERLDAVAGVERIETPYSGKDRTAVSPDGHSALVTFRIPGDAELLPVKDKVDASVKAVDAAAAANPGFLLEQSGAGSSEEEFQEIFNSDLQKATTSSLPITLLVLLVAFGALVAAGIPLLLAITGVIGTLGLVGPLSQLTPVDDGVGHVILLIGLAVGVDYALFYLRRVRE